MKVAYKTWKVCLRYRPKGATDFSWGKYYDVMLEAWGRMEFTHEMLHDTTGVSPSNVTMKKLEKLVKEAEVMPKWYGFAYRDFNRDVYVAYPIPINLIVAGSRWVSAKVKFEWPHLLDGWSGTLRKGFREGFNYGHMQGFIEATKLQLIVYPANASEEVKETVATNEYKKIYGPPESDLIVELKLKEKVKLPEPVVTHDKANKEVHVAYDTPVKSWDVITNIPKELEKIYESKQPLLESKPYFEMDYKKIYENEKLEQGKLKHQILQYLKLQINHNPDASKVAQLMHSAKFDLHMTDEELLKAINEFTDK